MILDYKVVPQHVDSTKNAVKVLLTNHVIVLAVIVLRELVRFAQVVADRLHRPQDVATRLASVLATLVKGLPIGYLLAFVAVLEEMSTSSPGLLGLGTLFHLMGDVIVEFFTAILPLFTLSALLWRMRTLNLLRCLCRKTLSRQTLVGFCFQKMTASE